LYNNQNVKRFVIVGEFYCETKVKKKNQSCKGAWQTFIIQLNWLTLQP